MFSISSTTLLGPLPPIPEEEPHVQLTPKEFSIVDLSRAIQALDFRAISHILPEEFAPRFFEAKAKMLFGRPTPDNLIEMLFFLAISNNCLNYLPRLPLPFPNEQKLAERVSTKSGFVDFRDYFGRFSILFSGGIYES